MKAVLISIQPYWVFLIIARIMGWKIDKEKTTEVRKNFPKDQDWNRNVKIFCSRDKKSFGKIPKEYQPLMERFLGKVIGEFVCDSVEMVNAGCSDYGIDLFYHDCMTKGCLTESEVDKYFNIPEDKDLRVMKGNGYAWHISDLTIYDKPKELSEFRKPCPYTDGTYCIENKCEYYGDWTGVCRCWVERPPQSWCYVEVQNG